MGDFGEWHVGDPIGFGNDTGAPEVPYMGYGPKGDDEKDSGPNQEEIEENHRRYVSSVLSEEAWRLFREQRIDEALMLIDLAIENNNTGRNWKRKATMMKELGRFDDALECYDNALSEKSSNGRILHDKAIFLIEYAENLFIARQTQQASINLTEAMDIFSRINNTSGYDKAWDLKARIALDHDDYEEAFECYKHALEIVGDDAKLKEEYKRKRDELLKHFNVMGTICPECGNNVLITDSFCIKCGAHIEFKNPNPKRGNDLKKESWGEEDILHFDED